MYVGRVHGRISKMRRLHMNRLVLLLDSIISGWFVCLWVLYFTHVMEKVFGPWSETSQHGDFEKKARNNAIQRRKHMSLSRHRIDFLETEIQYRENKTEYIHRYIHIYARHLPMPKVLCWVIYLIWESVDVFADVFKGRLFNVEPVASLALQVLWPIPLIKHRNWREKSRST